jgi:hypothetical protein
VLLGPWIPLVLERIPCSPTTGLASKQLHHIHIISAYHGRDRFLLAAQEKLKKTCQVKKTKKTCGPFFFGTEDAFFVKKSFRFVDAVLDIIE